MKVYTLTTVFAIAGIAMIATPSLRAGQKTGGANANASCYSSLLSGAPQTLSAFIESLNANGTVEVNGSDSQQPTTPFQFAWGDGSSTSGFFPQPHMYANVSQNYAITITATENNGTTQQFSFPVFFLGPPITAQTLPGVSFQIPSNAAQLGFSPPSGETFFSDSSFPMYSRSDVAYILAAVSSVDYNFANNNNGRLVNGVFTIDMLENISFEGGYAFSGNTPMMVGYGNTVVNPAPQWHILFNEIGKDTTLNTPASFPYGGNIDGHASEIYTETMGDIFSYASGCQLISNAASYGLGKEVAVDIGNSMLAGAANLQATYSNYVKMGAPFSSWNPGTGTDPTLGTISTLAWKFIEHAEQQGRGYQTPAQRMMQLLQLFNSSMLASYAPADDTPAAATFRSTLMVTALSYGFSQDLRSEFISLNFPIDDPTFEQLYEMATSGGAKLSPAAESFRTVAVGSTSAGKTITLTNYLLTPVTVSASFSGSDPNDFPVQASSTCPNPGGTLMANSSCTYVLAFKPSVGASESATFSVAETAQDTSLPLPNSPQSVALSGTGKTKRSH